MHLPETFSPVLLRCIRHPVSHVLFYLNTGARLTQESVRKHGQVQSSRVGLNISWLHGYPIYHPHLRFLLEGPNYPREIQIRASARQRQEESQAQGFSMWLWRKSSRRAVFFGDFSIEKFTVRPEEAKGMVSLGAIGRCLLSESIYLHLHTRFRV